MSTGFLTAPALGQTINPVAQRGECIEEGSTKRMEGTVLEGCHAGNLLAGEKTELDLKSGHEDFDSLFGEKIATSGSAKAFADVLANAKRDAASIYAKAIVGTLDSYANVHEELGRFWSSFADWTIDRTLHYVLASPAISRFLPTDTAESGLAEGLFVLGLGKLGGEDLNYSSDVDLVAFFDTDLFQVRSGAGKTDIATRTLKALTQILGGTHGPRIWRVDWRLRPDPSLTGLAMSTEAALDYHFFHAAPWRRLAMMKSRVVAGDRACGDRFLKELEPFVWRRTLDYRAIEELSSIKQRIRDEHPGLTIEREQEAPMDQLHGFNTKLGIGGIREIEFVVNGLQLIWGGRNAQIKGTHTLTAMRALNKDGLLSDGNYITLADAYRTFRGLENRIQLIDDGHVHNVPEAQDDGGKSFTRLLALCGEANADVLEVEVKNLRAGVHAQFEAIFASAPVTKDAPEIAPALEKALQPQHLDTLKAWQKGFSGYGAPAETAARLTPLFTSLNGFLVKSADPNAALAAIDAYFRSLPPGGQYLRLLAENAQLIGDILGPLASGGAMGRLLRHSPHVVDTLIQRRGSAVTEADERHALCAHVGDQRDTELQLHAMRDHVNELLYLAYLRVWRGEISPADGRALLTELALEALAETLALVRVQTGDHDTGLSIAGYGKLGMAAMMPESDLDVVFMAHGSDALELEDVQSTHRFAGRLKTALSAEMKGGKVYEIDTRLRPSGASGAPTVRLATFESHQMERAKTWEHLALVPAQFAVGPEFAREAFDAVRQAALTRARDQKTCAQDAHSMLSQLREHRIEKFDSKAFALKLIPGGLMETEFLISFLVLKHAHDNPNLVALPYSELALELETIDDDLAGLADAISLYQDVHLCERLLGWTGQPIKSIAVKASPLAIERKALKARIGEVSKQIRQMIKSQIIDASGLSSQQLLAHAENAVVWGDG